MNIGFFEVEKWAEDKIKSAFPGAIISANKINQVNVDRFISLDIISSFIYSNLRLEVLEKLRHLKFIATRSTGCDHIDLQYCKKNNIIVSNVPTYGERTVAEHTFGLILTLTRKLYESIDRTKHGNFSIIGLKGVDLFGKTIGIIGLGNIGKEVLKIAKSFGMNVLVCTKTEKPEMAQKYGFDYVQLDELLRRADVISLHVPYTPETHHLINKHNIVNLKKGSYLINTARGGLIDSEAIFVALEMNILDGVGLDVLEEELVLKEEAELLSSEFRKKVNYESLVFDHLILRHPKVIVTPHNAFNSQEALERILSTTIENIHAFLNKTPQNTV